MTNDHLFEIEEIIKSGSPQDCLVNSENVRELVLSLKAERQKVADLEDSFKLENVIMNIRKHHQLNIYTVNNIWVVQLFDLNVCANDNINCVYEISSTSLRVALTLTEEWIFENYSEN